MKDLIVIAYVPVLHEGYRRFFLDCLSRADKLLIINPLDVDCRSLRKDVRALNPQLVQAAVSAWRIFSQVEVFSPERMMIPTYTKVIMPKDEVSRLFADKYLVGIPIIYGNVFLRWDREKAIAQRPVNVQQTLTANSLEQTLMLQAIALGQQSSDWWRSVGALAVKDGKILLAAWNTHVPNEQQPYYDGDPRAEFSRGVNIELSTSDHAEAIIVATAANEGLSLKGVDLYVSTFPCPPCAKLVARAGIKRLYFHDGYAMLDGESILSASGVEISQVLFD